VARVLGVQGLVTSSKKTAKKGRTCIVHDRPFFVEVIAGDRYKVAVIVLRSIEIDLEMTYV